MLKLRLIQLSSVFLLAFTAIFMSKVAITKPADYITEQPFAITHGFINVVDQANPVFNLWFDDHVAQGFAWQEGSVSFGVPDFDGWPLVRVREVTEFPPLTSDVRRAIRVPFHSKSNIVIASVVDEMPTPIGAGDYSIEFRILNTPPPTDPIENYSYIIDLLIKKGKSTEFLILRKSDEVTSDKVITKSARSATF